jgi:hypothetical protein
MHARRYLQAVKAGPAVVALLAVLAVPWISGCGGIGSLPSSSARAAAARHEAAKQRSAHRFFSPTSFWNQPLPADAPLAPDSAALVGELDAQVAGLQAGGQGPWINTRAWSVPVYTVGATQPKVRVRLLTTSPERALQAAWRAVPLPANAQPALGKDAHLVVWQPASDRLWEFWHLHLGPKGWSAAWGGAIRHVSRSDGVYGPGAWPGARPWWGASASSLSIAGGLITLEDLEHGKIEHALAIAIGQVRAGVYASPARRDDGQSSDPLSLPEGARLRLPAGLDLEALHLPKLTLELAQAAQRYGFVVRDRSFGITLFAQDPVSTGTEPFAGPSGYFEGRYPNQLLASFPWDQLQVLALHLHPNGAGSRRGPQVGCTSACTASGRRKP